MKSSSINSAIIGLLMASNHVNAIQMFTIEDDKSLSETEPMVYSYYRASRMSNHANQRAFSAIIIPGSHETGVYNTPLDGGEAQQWSLTHHTQRLDIGRQCHP